MNAQTTYLYIIFTAQKLSTFFMFESFNLERNRKFTLGVFDGNNTKKMEKKLIRTLSK